MFKYSLQKEQKSEEKYSVGNTRNIKTTNFVTKVQKALKGRMTDNKGRGKVKKKTEWQQKGQSGSQKGKKTTAQRANKCRTSPYGFFLFSNSIFELKLRLFPMHRYLLIKHGTYYTVLFDTIHYIHHNLPRNIPIKRKHNLTVWKSILSWKYQDFRFGTGQHRMTARLKQWKSSHFPDRPAHSGKRCKKG